MIPPSGQEISPLASVVIPTRNRAEYLKTTLESLVNQSVGHHFYEIVVVDDGSDHPQRIKSTFDEIAFGELDARLIQLKSSRGANAARNEGIAGSDGDLIVIVDDDIDAPPDWLKAYLTAADAYPQHEAFGGAIKARLEGSHLPFCGRERPPITVLDLGASDRDARRVWSANMAIRRSAVERVGNFDTTFMTYGGQEEEWEQRLLDAGGSIRYVAGAWLWHRRSRRDSRLWPLARAAYWQGRGLRSFDQRWSQAKPLRSELRVLAGCLWHTLRYRCANGIIMAANCVGRIVEAVRSR